MAQCFIIDTIQYDSDLRILKDVTSNKKVAYFSSSWKVMSLNLPQDNKPISGAIIEFVSRLNEEAPTGDKETSKDIFLKEFLLILEKQISDYSCRSVDNSLLALELDPELISVEQDSLISVLNDLKISSSKIKDPHISLSYLKDSVPLSIIQNEIGKAQKIDWRFKVKSIKVLPGLSTPKDYICLELSAPDSFYSLINEINEDTKCNKIAFPGGFKAHISLLQIDKGILTEDVISKIYNRLCSYELKISPIIHPQAISLFNKSKSVEIRRKCRNARKKKQ